MKKIIFSEDVPSPIGPYSQAVMSGNTLYTSGQIGMDPKSGNLIIDTIENETEQVMKNLDALLDKAEMKFSDVVKATIFISDMGNFNKINSIYSKYFDTQNAPARETVEVSCLPKNVNVEISMIAIRN